MTSFRPRFPLRLALAPTAFILALASALPAHSETGAGAPAVLSPAEFAPALIRQDMVPGVYEVVHSAKLGVIFVASAPSHEAKDLGVVRVFDAANLQLLREIQLPHRAFALALDDEAGRLYVGHTFNGALSIVGAASGQVFETLQLGKADEEGRFEHTRMIALDPSRDRAFLTNPSREGVVWLVDTAVASLVKRVDDAGLWAAGAAADPAKGLFYSAGGGHEEIGIFDAESGERVGSLSTGDTKAGAEADDSAHFFVNLDIDREGRRLFASDGNSQQLYVFDLDTGDVIAKVPTGPGTLDVVFNPQRDEAYVTYRGASREDETLSGGLTVIDTKAMVQRQDLPLIGHPNSLEVSDDGQTLFMTLKMPRREGHPAWREGIRDSVLRFDLAKLSAAGG